MFLEVFKMYQLRYLRLLPLFGLSVAFVSSSPARAQGLSPGAIASQLEGAAQQGADWGMAIGTMVIALFLFVIFMSFLFSYLRS